MFIGPKCALISRRAVVLLGLTLLVLPGLSQATTIYTPFEVDLVGTISGTYAGHVVWDDSSITGVGFETLIPAGGGLLDLFFDITHASLPAAPYTLGESTGLPAQPELGLLNGMPTTLGWEVGAELFMDLNTGNVQVGDDLFQNPVLGEGVIQFGASSEIPEPSTYLLVGLGVFGIAILRRRKTAVGASAGQSHAG